MLQEREIFDAMKSNMLSAASDCDEIARQPASGMLFVRMRKSLKLAEGACRQAAHWRSDSRWLIPGKRIEVAHQIARSWLHRPTVESKKLFVQLAGALRQMVRDLDRLQFMKTGRVGIILPEHGLEEAPNQLVRISHLPSNLPLGLIQRA